MRQDTLRGVVTFLCSLVGLMMFVVQGGAQGEQLYVRAGLANVRMSPQIEADNVLDTLPRGTEVTLIERQGAWYQVQLADERSGWMHQSVLSAEPVATIPAADREHRRDQVDDKEQLQEIAMESQSAAQRRHSEREQERVEQDRVAPVAVCVPTERPPMRV